VHTSPAVVALSLSVSHLATLFEQIKYHSQRTSASTSPVERCRRQLHTTTITASTLNICYFSLVLGNIRWLSVVVLMMNGIPNCIGGVVFTSRMWMYTNDPRLMRESPEIFALSTWLERPRGHIAAGCTMSIGPSIATIFALANNTELAARFVALGGVFVSNLILVVFWVCGRSLMRAIDNSLQLQTASSQSAGKAEGQNCGAGHRTLVEAKKKVRRMVMVTASLLFPAMTMGSLGAFTPYGVRAPLLMYGVPFALVPQIWLSMNVQLHSKRSHLRPGPNGNILSAWTSGHLATAALSRMPRSFARRQQQHVVPTQGPLPLP
ncbi:unnamed protein product, partial [Ectocarpus sp. 8 AP-2014]